VAAQQKLIALLQANQTAGSDGNLASAYLKLSWEQILARDFAGALATTDVGLKLKPGNLMFETDRAHALLFLGRKAEADALYRGNIGKKMVAADGSAMNATWEESILDDFTSMDQYGLSNPAIPGLRTMMQDVLLGAAKTAVAARPGDRLALEHWRGLASAYKRWAEAVDAQQRLLKLLQANPTPDRPALLDAYLGLSWYQVFARDFTGAVASADAGLKIDPRYLPLETNKAHALLFLNRVAEAEDIYRRNIGKKMRTSRDLWQTVILDDFNQLEAGGLKRPEIDRFRTMLKVGK